MHQVRYFLAVARTLNFTQAASQCNVAQPSLTRAIQKLEEELGGPLLHRERQNTHLTELGRLMLPHLERTYVASQAAKELAQGIRKGDTAHLRIGISESISAELLIDLLDGLAKCINGFELTLGRIPHKALITDTLEGDYDLVFISDAVELPEKMRSWVLFKEGFRLLMPADHRLSRFETVPLHELSGLEMIEQVGCADQENLKYFCANADIDLGFRHRVHGPDEMQRLVRGGFGLGLLPASIPLISGLVGRPLEEAATRGVAVGVVAGRPFMMATEACLRLARTRHWPATAVAT